MASQVLALNGPSGLPTPTARVFADGSDAQVSGSPFTLVEAANRKGYYECAFTGTLAGLHLVVLYAGANPVGSGWVTFVNSDGTFPVRGERGANVAYVNNVLVGGSGVSGDTWGPAT